MMKTIPRDTCDFPEIRQADYLYVDKTGYFHRLITTPGRKLFFFSRPRRFGKSLMISTLKAIFQGKRELFDGLAISRTDYDWKQYPVIHLNMGKCSAAEVQIFKELLVEMMRNALSDVDYTYNDSLNVICNFANAIEYFRRQGKQVVILIDEYDDPVAQVLGNIEEAEKIRAYLAPLYRQIKEHVGAIRFVMITGVSKFTKMSVFSAMSNLQDISFEDDYATMLGFTEKELDDNYGEYMAAHARKMKLTRKAYRAELKRMYNGYRFWRIKGEKVYNPVSINLTLDSREDFFECHWADTGRPAMLMNYLKRESVLAVDPERIRGVMASEFDVMDLRDIPISGLLYQTGYLTIQDFEKYTQAYTLGIPDEEVRRDFAVLMASLCAKKSVAWAAGLAGRLFQAEWDAFFRGLESLYAGVAYGPKEKRVCEFSYARCLTFLLQGQGIVCRQEEEQASGRADVIATHPCGVYIFELKVDEPAAIAMDQAKRKEYALPYSADSRPIWLIGLSFDSATRHLVDTAAEQYH